MKIDKNTLKLSWFDRIKMKIFGKRIIAVDYGTGVNVTVYSRYLDGKMLIVRIEEEVNE